MIYSVCGNALELLPDTLCTCPADPHECAGCRHDVCGRSGARANVEVVGVLSSNCSTDNPAEIGFVQELGMGQLVSSNRPAFLPPFKRVCLLGIAGGAGQTPHGCHARYSLFRKDLRRVCWQCAWHSQEELGKRQMDLKWDPLKGKKQLVDRLQVCMQCILTLDGWALVSDKCSVMKIHVQAKTDALATGRRWLRF